MLAPVRYQTKQEASMDRETREVVRAAVGIAAGQMQRELGPPRRRCRFQDELIVTLYLQAVKRGLCSSRATAPEHSRRGTRRSLPSVSLQPPPPIGALPV